MNMSKQQLDTYAKWAAIAAAGMFAIDFVTHKKMFDDWPKYGAITAAVLFGLGMVLK